MIDPIAPTARTSGGPALLGGVDQVTSGPGAVAANAEAGVDFGTMLTQLASNAADAVRNAESISIAGIQGRATVQQVVEAVMNAEQTLQGAVAIRDKVVAAYLELSRMQI
jgi:flagellar hook-basal body complex protein FliE